MKIIDINRVQKNTNLLLSFLSWNINYSYYVDFFLFFQFFLLILLILLNNYKFLVYVYNCLTFVDPTKLIWAYTPDIYERMSRSWYEALASIGWRKKKKFVSEDKWRETLAQPEDDLDRALIADYNNNEIEVIQFTSNFIFLVLLNIYVILFYLHYLRGWKTYHFVILFIRFSSYRIWQPKYKMTKNYKYDQNSDIGEYEQMYRGIEYVNEKVDEDHYEYLVEKYKRKIIAKKIKIKLGHKDRLKKKWRDKQEKMGKFDEGDKSVKEFSSVYRFARKKVY